MVKTERRNKDTKKKKELLLSIKLKDKPFEKIADKNEVNKKTIKRFLEIKNSLVLNASIICKTKIKITKIIKATFTNKGFENKKSNGNKKPKAKKQYFDKSLMLGICFLKF